MYKHMTNLANRVFLCTVVNLFALLFLSSLRDETVSLSVCFPCIMGSRILINLREVALTQARPPTNTNISALRFAQPTRRRRPVHSDTFSLDSYVEGEVRRSVF